MNKWSLLLFSVLGLLLSTTSELNFVDGRLECCARSSRPLLSDTRLSIYEPHRAYDTFTEITQLISPKRDIRYDSKNVELKRSTRSDRRREQSEGRRISSDKRFRDLSNVVLDLEDSTSSYSRIKKEFREINDLQSRRNLKSFSRDNFRENRVGRSRSGNDNFLENEMKRNSREEEINIQEELTKNRDNRFRHNDGSVSANPKDHQQQRFNRRTFIIRTNIMASENIVETSLRFIQKNKAKRDTERRNPVINARQRLLRETHLTSELSRNSDARFRRADRSIQFVSKIGILRNGLIRNYRRLSVRGDSITKIYEKESLNAVRRNTDTEDTINVYRRSYDENNSEDILERNNKKNVVIRVQNERFTPLDKRLSRPNTIQSENEGLANRTPDDKRQVNNGFEKRLFEERYSTRRLPRQNSNINRLKQTRVYNDIIIGDKQYSSNVLIEATERASDQSRKRRIRENNREIRIVEEYMADRITPGNKNNHVEKRAVILNINIRRSEPNRRSVLERLERENSRYSLDHENGNNFDQRRIRQIGNRHNEDKLREARNTQRKSIRSTAMGQEINNIRQNYEDDNVSQGFLLRNSNNRKLVNRLEHERLSRTGKRTSQIRIIQREHQNKNIRATNLQENRIQEDPSFIRLVSNTNRNVEKRQAIIYNDKSDREELTNSLVREAERAFDEIRTRQVRDINDHGRKYGLNVERTVDRVLTHIDRKRDNVVESGFVSTISIIVKNRLYGRIRSDVAVLRRRENYKISYSSAHGNERIFDQRNTRGVLERREKDVRNENAAQNSPPRNSMKDAVLNNNRRSYNDENNSQVILAKTKQSEITNRSERERSSSVNKRSSYLRMIQREHENRMHNDYRQLMNIQENRLRTERCAMRCLAGQAFDINRIVEDRRTGNGILRNRRELSRIEDHSRNIRIAEIRGLQNINERSNTRDTRNKLITRYFGTEVEFNDFDETHHERRTERFIRNIDRHRVSINNRDLLEARSEKQRDVNRELEYIRNYNGLEKSALRENKENIRQTSDRKYNRGRDAQVRARDIRATNGLQILKKVSRITKTRRSDEQEREIRTGFSKLRYLPIEYRTQADKHIFEIKLQYIFYMLQGIYILGLFTKFTMNSDGIQKRTRCTNWFPLFSTLKVY